LIAILLGLGVTAASAQLAFYVDETGRRVYVNPEPKPDTSVPKATAPSRLVRGVKKQSKIVKPAATLAQPVVKSASFAAPAAPSAQVASDSATNISKTPSSTSTSLDAVVEQTARRHEVDVNLVKAMIHTESNSNPRAVSSKGALGLMQLMPFTARDLGVTNVFDPAQNVDGGVRYLKSLLTQFGGDLSLSLAAYNAGPGAVTRYGGVPPYRETVNYVKKIGNLYGSLHAQAPQPAKQPGITRTVDENGKVVYTNLP